MARLARAEAARLLGESVDDMTAEAVLGNIDAMELAVSQLSSKERLHVADILAIHRALMQHTNPPTTGGQMHTVQNSRPPSLPVARFRPQIWRLRV